MLVSHLNEGESAHGVSAFSGLLLSASRSWGFGEGQKEGRDRSGNLPCPIRLLWRCLWREEDTSAKTEPTVPMRRKGRDWDKRGGGEKRGAKLSGTQHLNLSLFYPFRFSRVNGFGKGGA